MAVTRNASRTRRKVQCSMSLIAGVCVCVRHWRPAHQHNGSPVLSAHGRHAPHSILLESQPTALAYLL
jgi:hypothetical protein